MHRQDIKPNLYSNQVEKTMCLDINIRKALLFRNYALPMHKFWKTYGLAASWEVGITKYTLRKEAGNKQKKHEKCYAYFAFSKICIDYAKKTRKKEENLWFLWENYANISIFFSSSELNLHPPWVAHFFDIVPTFLGKLMHRSCIMQWTNISFNKRMHTYWEKCNAYYSFVHNT